MGVAVDPESGSLWDPGRLSGHRARGVWVREEVRVPETCRHGAHNP